MPDVFSYNTDREDYALAGVWVECKALEETELTNKITQMNTKDSSYGFISNTKTNAMTEDEQEAIQIFLENLSANNVWVGAFDNPQIENITNPSRSVIRIINTNILEPIKAIGHMNNEEERIEIRIVHNVNEIEKVLNGNGVELTKQDNIYIQLEDDITSAYYVKDNKGNIREISYDNMLLIRNVEELNKFRDSVNAGNNYEGIYVMQVSDIDMSSVCGRNIGSWTPIGATGTYFAGTYNGGYHIIDNLYINTSSLRILGFFAQNPATSTIKNILMKDIFIYNSYSDESAIMYAGGIVGNNLGQIKNCAILSGSITGYKTSTSSTFNVAYAAGIAGTNSNLIDSCYNSAKITAQNGKSGSSQARAGGIVGTQITNLSAITSNCYNTGEVTTSAKGNYCGGIIGIQAAQNTTGTSKPAVRNCYNYGKIYSNIDTKLSEWCYVGSIAGTNGNGSSSAAGILENCYGLNNMNIAYYYWNGSAVAQSTVNMLNESELKSSATRLGDAFETDQYNINNGYPILYWQVSNVPIYAELDFNNDLVNIKIKYHKNDILKVINQNGQELTKVNDNLYTENATSGKKEYTIIDSVGNERKLFIDLKVIENAEGLSKFRDEVNAGNNFAGKTVLQVADIDMSSICGESTGSWEPVGNDSTYFKGTYDGRNHSINNIYINNSNQDNVGLFGKIDGGKVNNISVLGTITGKSNTGGIVGYVIGNNVEFNNCTNNANITSSQYSAGGIVGYARDNIKIINCTNNSSVIANLDAAGGIVGNALKLKNAEIIKCVNNAQITATNSLGGIIGAINTYSTAYIKQCINNGDITASSKSNAGGICGIAINGVIVKIDQCCNFGNIYANQYSSGGCIGANINGAQVTVSNSYNMGDIGTGIGSHAGILGNMSNSVSDYGNPYTTIINCYNAGQIAQVGSYGAIIGYSANSSWYSLTNNYWETGKGASRGIGYPSSNTGTTSASAATLKTYATNLGSAYRADTTPNINNGYPILRWQVEE